MVKVKVKLSNGAIKTAEVKLFSEPFSISYYDEKGGRISYETIGEVLSKKYGTMSTGGVLKIREFIPASLIKTPEGRTLLVRFNARNQVDEAIGEVERFY
ncbi:MAG: hypothetical protein ACP5KW_12335 [Thermoproteota archaeon]